MPIRPSLELALCSVPVLGGTGHGIIPGFSTPLLAILTFPTLPRLDGLLTPRSLVCMLLIEFLGLPDCEEGGRENPAARVDGSMGGPSGTSRSLRGILTRRRLELGVRGGRDGSGWVNGREGVMGETRGWLEPLGETKGWFELAWLLRSAARCRAAGRRLEPRYFSLIVGLGGRESG